MHDVVVCCLAVLVILAVLKFIKRRIVAGVLSILVIMGIVAKYLPEILNFV